MGDFTFSGAILAGGRSSRMGRDKAFLPIEGRPLIARQASLLREAGCSELIISGLRDIDYGIPNTLVVYDSVQDVGPLAGLAAALSAARHPWVLVIAVDLPRLDLTFLRRLLSLGAGRTGIVPHVPHGFEPLTALYPRTLLLEAEKAVSAGNYSLQALMTAAEKLSLIKRLELSPPEQDALVNWNNPQDYGLKNSGES